MKIAAVALIPSLVLAASSALGEVYTCTAASNRAKVGASSGSEVGITSDTDKKECRFSVNGATVGSPPFSAIVAGMNAIIGGKAASMLRNREVEPIANLLISSSEHKVPSRELLDVLRQNSDELAKCLESFMGSVERIFVSKDNVFCGAAKDGAIPISGKTVSISDSRGIHVLAVSPSKNLTHFLFYPAAFRNGQLIPLPPR